MSKLKRKKINKTGICNVSRFGTVKNKVVLVGVGLLIIAIGIVIILRFSTPEDTWLCTENGWEKHGNPKTEMPKVECVITANTSQL